MDRLGQDLGIRQQAPHGLAVSPIGDDHHVDRVDEGHQARRGACQDGPSVWRGLESDWDLPAGERLLAGPAVRKDDQVHRVNHAP